MHVIPARIFATFLISSICYVYFRWYLKKDNIGSNFNVGYLNV